MPKSSHQWLLLLQTQLSYSSWASLPQRIVFYRFQEFQLLEFPATIFGIVYIQMNLMLEL